MTPLRILAVVCAYYDIAPVRVLSGSRAQIVGIARQITIALSTELTLFSPNDLAAVLGIDRSSVKHGLRRHREACAEARYARDHAAIRARVIAGDGETSPGNGPLSDAGADPLRLDCSSADRASTEELKGCFNGCKP